MRHATVLETVDIGGWKVAKMFLPQGAKYYSIVTGHRTRAEVGYVAVWTKGRIEGLNLTTGQALTVREPFLVSSDLPEMSIGRIEFTAIQDTEWLCFDAKLNGGAVPTISIVDGVDASAEMPLYTEHTLAPGVILVVQTRSS